MRLTSVVALTGAIGMLTASCSSTTSPDPNAIASPVVYAQGICNFFARCQPAFVRAHFGSVEACSSAYVAPATDLLHSRGANITKRLLDACLVRTEKASCDDDIESLPECDFKGTLGDGASCTSGVQCATGSCFFSDPAASCGVCSPRALAGGDCTSAACAPDLQCVNHQCVPFGDPGAPCGDATCKTNLMCSPAGSCVVPRKKDEPCDPSGAGGAICDAAQGLTCANGTCAAVLVKAGQPCDRYPFCESSVCIANVCQQHLGEGAACSASNECAFPLSCKPSPNGGRTCQKTSPASCP